ncbi:hypothetical protein AZOA_26980 [Azoarcus sp. Aa7]|nr:hypothetical protein [Azoarcus sp. Aa7]
MPLADFALNIALPLLSGGTAGWALIHFFGQRLVDHRLAKDLEHYREELKENTEVLKSQLSIYAHEQTVAISRVDSQRSEAIHKIYRCMRDVINPVSSIVAGTPIVNGTKSQSADFYLQNAEAAHAACGVLAHTMADLAIYFDNNTYKNIANFANVSMQATATYLQPLRPLVALGHAPDEILYAAETGRAALQEKFETELTPAMKSLTAAFRIHLGIERTQTIALPK